MSFRKLLYLPHIVVGHKKRTFLFLAIIVLLSGGSLAVRSYLKITTSVPQIGGYYVEGLIKEPRAINPLFAGQDADRDIARLVFSGLLKYSGKGVIQPDLAQNFEVSPDGKIYTVFLKENVRWHDGRALDADDVVFTVKTIQNPQYKSVLRANWQGVAVEKINQHTVKFTLRAPYAPFIENLTTGIIPKRLWEGVGPEQAILHELNLKPIGSGPYKFDRFKQAKDGTLIWYRVARNSEYHGEGPYLKKITFVFFKDEAEALAALRKGLINGFGPISTALLKEFDQGRTAILAIPMPRIFGVFFNEKRSSALSDKKVREAITRAIDRNTIAKQATAGGAIPYDSPLPLAKRDGSGEYLFPYDPEKAKTLLEEAGWKDEDGDGIREKRVRRKGKEEKTPLRFTLVTSDWPELLRVADVIKNLLRAVGIEIDVEKRVFAELEAGVIRPRDFELLLFGQVYGYEPDPFAFWHSSQIKDPGLNIALYANKKADQLLEEARRTSDSEERRKRYGEFIKIVTGDLPAVFLYSQLYLHLIPSDLKGVELEKISLPADRFNEVNKWYRETKRVLK